MGQRSHVPKFGNWESEENVEYSAYFEEASKAKAKLIYPNDPLDKPDRFANSPAQVQASAFETELGGKVPKGPEVVKSRHERCTSQEDSDLGRPNDQPHGCLQSYGKAEPEAPKDPEGLMSLIKKEMLMSKQKQQFSQEEDAPRKSVDSALQHETLGGRRVTSESPLRHQVGGVAGNGPLKAVRHSAVSERSIENSPLHSPLHSHYQARVGGKGSGVSSPSWERKGSSQHSNQGFAPSTPGRSRLKPNARGNETPDHSSAVPKFGDWDESNPASGEGYTRIFNKVLEERQNEAGRGPVLTNETSQFNGQMQCGNENTKRCCCFPWS